ncbi:hypothetical protein EVAR_74768_1 [Eumeta japonica]|uniref:Uncharacterized protein n=1 Tax=Eumeta variegata TaxID=151549 RepID=A0A4C1SS12_EUMVA|nr:hypothetical protein EVAR_74768_1 [Eumeta japonica]
MRLSMRKWFSLARNKNQFVNSTIVIRIRIQPMTSVTKTAVLTTYSPSLLKNEVTKSESGVVDINVSLWSERYQTGEDNWLSILPNMSLKNEVKFEHFEMVITKAKLQDRLNINMDDMYSESIRLKEIQRKFTDGTGTSQTEIDFGIGAKSEPAVTLLGMTESEIDIKTKKFSTLFYNYILWGLHCKVQRKGQYRKRGIEINIEKKLESGSGLMRDQKLDQSENLNLFPFRLDLSCFTHPKPYNPTPITTQQNLRYLPNSLVGMEGGRRAVGAGGGRPSEGASPTDWGSAPHCLGSRRPGSTEPLISLLLAVYYTKRLARLHTLDYII